MTYTDKLTKIVQILHTDFNYRYTVFMWYFLQPTFFLFICSETFFSALKSDGRFRKPTYGPWKIIFFTIERLMEFPRDAALEREEPFRWVSELVLVLAGWIEVWDTLSIMQSSSLKKWASFLFVLIAESTSSRSTSPITVTFWFVKSVSMEYNPFIWARAFRIFRSQPGEYNGTLISTRCGVTFCNHRFRQQSLRPA